MSRIGKLPVTVPSGVKVALNGSTLSIEGPKGKLQGHVKEGIVVTVKDGQVFLTLSETGQSRQLDADWGTLRAHIKNMLNGVSQGFKRSLEMVGVGYGAKVQGKELIVSAGYSHEVKFEVPEGIKCAIEKGTTINLESADRSAVGIFAARIRRIRPPEPYLGKGIKFSEEKVRRKAGKTGKKAA